MVCRWCLPISASILLLSLFGCDGSDVTSSLSTEKAETAIEVKNSDVIVPDSAPVSTVTLQGAVQKGIYEVGSAVTATLLNADGSLASVSQTVTMSTQGQYALQLTQVGWYLLEATGTYLDEVTNKPSVEPYTLSALVRVQTSNLGEVGAKLQVNLNLFTHFVRERAQQLMASRGDSLTEATSKSVEELRLATGLSENVGSMINQLDITENSTDEAPDNKILLLFSGAALTVADNDPEMSVPAVLNKLAVQFQQSGSLDDDEVEGREDIFEALASEAANPKLTDKLLTNLNSQGVTLPAVFGPTTDLPFWVKREPTNTVSTKTVPADTTAADTTPTDTTPADTTTADTAPTDTTPTDTAPTNTAPTNTAPTISGQPVASIEVGQKWSFTPTLFDADNDSLSVTTGNIPSWLHWDADTGILSGIPEDADIKHFDHILLTVSDGTLSSALPPFSVEVLENPMEKALRLGDARGVSVEDLYDEAVKTFSATQAQCLERVAFIHGDTWASEDVVWSSNYSTSQNPQNTPLYVATLDNGSTRTYGWIGEQPSGARYAYSGIDLFTSGQNSQSYLNLKEQTIQQIKWLLGLERNADLFSEARTIVVNSNSTRSQLNSWLDIVASGHQWTVSSDLALLDSGQFDLYIHNRPNDTVSIAKVQSQLKPVLIYTTWQYVYKTPILSYFDLASGWNGSQTVNDLPTRDDLCSGSSANSIMTALTTIQENNFGFQYTDQNCVNSIGTVKCRAEDIFNGNSQSLQEQIQNGVSTLRSILNSFDKQGKALFSLSNDHRLVKLAVLIADKYREAIAYPMDKNTTDQQDFYSAYFADYGVHYSRVNNPLQPDLGTFTEDPIGLLSESTMDKTLVLTPTLYNEWTSTGLYALPGKMVTIKRMDDSVNNIQVRFSMIRSSTRVWNNNQYGRPLYVASPSVSLESGKTYKLSSPYGGPIYVYSQGVAAPAAPFELAIEGVAQHPLLEDFSSISIGAFKTKLDTSAFDWVDIKTPYAEIHSLRNNMRRAFASYNDDVVAYLQDIDNYLIKSNYAYAGFVGEGLSEINAEVKSFCSDNGLLEDCVDAVLHKKPKVQHINSDVSALCGGLCSGNPFDSGSPINPLGWGESHEMGHNLQRNRLKIYGRRSGEVSNNIFPLQMMRNWTINEGLEKHPTQTRPNHRAAFEILQQAISGGVAATEATHPLWSETGTYSKAFERLSFYIQLIYTDNWDIYTKMYLWERIFNAAIKTEENWTLKKQALGFSAYDRTDANDISGNDFMYIVASYITGKDYKDYFAAWGVSVSDAAKAQVFLNAPSGTVAAEFYYLADPHLPVNHPVITIPLDGVSAWAGPSS